MRYRWVVLAAGTFAQATYSGIWFGAAVMAPALRERYGLSLGQTGVLISGSLAGSVLSMIPWGLATDRLGERAVLAAGLTACGGALVLASEASDFRTLAALIVLAGAAGASVNSASGRAVMHWFGPHERGFALGIRQTAIPISGLVFSLVLPPVVRAGGVGWGFGVLGASCLAGAALTAAFLKEGPRPADEEGTGLVPPFRDRRIWRLASGSALIVAPQMCVVGFTVLFLHDRRGLSPSRAAAVLAVVQLLGIGARIGAGRWSDVLRSRIMPMRRLALAMAVLVVLTTALLTAPLAFLVPTLVLTGVLAMSWNGLAFAAAAELAGHARSGAAIGLQQTVLNSFSAIYPAAFGAVVAATSWRAGFALVALLPLAGFVVLRKIA
ncbi:MAG TPA: MFS transporter [Gaiellaceae bacterium]